MTNGLPERTPRKRLTREEGKALTRSRLLTSAQALFATQGFEGTSVDDIARDAGYTRGAFYANFANKEAVMAELMKSGFEGDLAGIHEMATVEDPEEAARHYARLARAFSEDPESTLWMLEFQLAAVRHPGLRNEYASQFDRLRHAVAGIVRLTYEREQLPHPERAEGFADVFIAVLSGVSLIRILDPDRIDDTLFERTFRALVTGIRDEFWGDAAE